MINFFDGCSWFKFNNLRLALVVTLKFYTSVPGLKLKSRNFLGIISKFVEITGEKLVGGGELFEPHILSMVKTRGLVSEIRGGLS